MLSLPPLPRGQVAFVVLISGLATPLASWRTLIEISHPCGTLRAICRVPRGNVRREYEVKGEGFLPSPRDKQSLACRLPSRCPGPGEAHPETALSLKALS